MAAAGFFGDALAVDVDGVVADAELARHFFVAQAQRQLPRHIALARRQARQQRLRLGTARVLAPNLVTNTSPRADFAVAVAQWPEVVACYAMTGEMDYLLRVHVEDMEHFSRFMMATLLRHPAVAANSLRFHHRTRHRTKEFP